jgi:leucyl aminopeptidase
MPVRVELRIASATRAESGAAARGVRWAAATTLARDLVNAPPNQIVPRTLAERARAVARDTGARVKVLDEREIKTLGMGALLAVGQGSQNPPRFIVLEHEPRGGSPRRAGARAGGAARARTGGVVLIGKGVTFDTGGISLKPREGMARMKYDLAGAAAVLGVFSALPVLDPPFRVVGLLPSAENMPGGRAFKPGDVVKTLDGATIEITNTDAEGRLLLADALAYARRLSPDAVVDLATLTGAVRLALGTHAAGLFTPDDALARELLTASRASGERLWRLPVGDEYAEALRSDVADLVNSAGPDGGASIAASFLARFARGMRWAHLDIASTAWAAQDRPHEPRGGTGFGVRLLLEWLAARKAAPREPAKRAVRGRNARPSRVRG